MVNMLHSLTVVFFLFYIRWHLDGGDDGSCDVLDLCSFEPWCNNIHLILNAFSFAICLLYFFLSENKIVSRFKLIERKIQKIIRIDQNHGIQL